MHAKDWSRKEGDGTLHTHTDHIPLITPDQGVSDPTTPQLLSCDKLDPRAVHNVCSHLSRKRRLMMKAPQQLGARADKSLRNWSELRHAWWKHYCLLRGAHRMMSSTRRIISEASVAESRMACFTLRGEWWGKMLGHVHVV